MKTRKYYMVYPIINGNEMAVKKFKSRAKANKYAFDMIYDNGLQLDHTINNFKHIEEFVCDDNYSRFVVSRIIR